MLAGLLEPLEQATPDVAVPEWLLSHQADAVLRAWAILERFGGVLVADGVGLGKTYVGLALAEFERARGGDALVLAPAALRREWQRSAEEVGVPLAFASHTALARRAPNLDERVSLLVVDEAHAFRNPRTRRYDTLARLAIGRRVVCLTATPVNNSVADLAALIHLFAGTERFRGLGVSDLFAALRTPDGESAALALGALTVCRSRRLVESRFPALRGAFPRRDLLPPTRYDLDAAYGGALREILTALAALEEVGGHEERGAALLALGLARRLESGRAAFLRSLRRFDHFLREWARAREHGRTLMRRSFRTHGRDADDGGFQLALWPLLLAPTLGGNVAGDHVWRGYIAHALTLVRKASTLPDEKLEALERLFTGPLRDRKTIVFTEFRDTALAIARHLRHRHRVLCVAGDGAWAGTERLPRRIALDAFAPRARTARPDRLLEADVLVATDVASEGMNLQDASAVVNYDLPWNPVRIMQRVGRIDRLNSAHSSVALAYLLPGHGLHDLTGVLRTLRQKLAGSPAAVTAEPDPLSALWWLDAAGPIPEALERESWRRVEPFEARERWRAAAGSGSTPRRPCVAAVVADDDAPPAVGILLALEWQNGAHIPLPFVLGPEGHCRCDAAGLGALAERALNARPIVASAPDFGTALAAVLPEARRRLLACSAARRGSPPQGPGRRAALLVVARAARAAVSARDATTLETLARVSAALSEELPAGLDRAVFDACRAGVPGPEMTASLDAALRSHDDRCLERLDGTPKLVFVAAVTVASRCPQDDPAPAGDHASVARVLPLR